MSSKIQLIILFFSAGFSVFAQEVAYDTTYQNSHYNMRQDIYDAMPDRKGEIIFVGNSITERVDFSELLNNNRIINRGIGGDICWGVYNRLGEILASKPKKIFLLIGINDIGKSIPVPVIARKYEQILERIKEDSPRTRVILQTVLPMNEDMLWYDYMKGKSAHIVLLNNEIKSLAKTYGLPLIDLHTEFQDENGSLKSELTSDGLHLNGAGYAYWMNAIKKSKIL